MLSCLIPIVQVFQLVIASVASAVLFAFAGLTLAGSVVALIVATPIFLIFSPVLVPATIATTLLATNVSAGALFGVTAVALIIWLIKHRMGVKPKDNPPPKGAPPTGAAAKSAENPADKPTGGSADKPPEMPVGGSADKPPGGPTDKPAGGPTDKPAGGPTDKPAGGPTDKPAGGPTDKPTGAPTDKPTGGPTDKPAEKNKPPM